MASVYKFSSSALSHRKNKILFLFLWLRLKCILNTYFEAGKIIISLNFPISQRGKIYCHVLIMRLRVPI